MITLRYHIVSITAVFLALGLGLTMGSAFLDRATVETLEGQLSGLEGDLRNSNQRIDELEGQVANQQRQSDLFAEQGVGPLLANELTDVPVIVFAVRGADETTVDRSLSALSAAGADVEGVWWATDRFALDDDAELRDLSTALGLETDIETRLRRTATQELASRLRERLAPVSDPESGVAEPGDDTGEAGEVPGSIEVPGEGELGEPGQTDGLDDPVEVPLAPSSELFDALVTAGFLEFQPLGDGTDSPFLPPAGARLVIITDTDASLDPEDFSIPLLRDLTVDGPAAVVLASGLRAGADPSTRGAVVDLVREHPELTDRVSTVDNLERFEGWAALVLTVEFVTEGRIAHFGMADTASRLLPALEGPT